MPEIHVGITAKQYHEELDGISQSMVRTHTMEGPLVYQARYILKTLPPKDSDALRFGRLFHLAMSELDWESKCHVYNETLENDQFLEVIRIVAGKSTVDMSVGAPINLQSKFHRDYVRLRREHAASLGQEWVKADDFNRIRRMKDSVWENPAVAELLECAYARHKAGLPTYEVAVTDIDPRTRLKRKALLDVYNPDYSDSRGKGRIHDFKTTERSRWFDFRTDARNYGYFHQAGWYPDVAKCDLFDFIVVRKCEPFETLLLNVPQSTIERYKVWNEQELAKLKGCMNLDSWHSEGWGGEIALEDEYA